MKISDLFNLKPDYQIDGSVINLTPETLLKDSIEGLILDLDNTIMPPKAGKIDEDILKWLENLKAKNIKTIVLTNNSSGGYLKEVEIVLRDLGMEMISRGCKPMRKNIFRALERLNLPKERVCLVGDRVLTDVLGGVRAGIKTALVKPLLGEQENALFRFLRKFEYMFLKENY